jgi:hypothetical protein
MGWEGLGSPAALWPCDGRGRDGRAGVGLRSAHRQQRQGGEGRGGKERKEERKLWLQAACLPACLPQSLTALAVKGRK